jgi:hypothetical protein
MRRKKVGNDVGKRGRHWDPVPGNDWWRPSTVRRRTACCSDWLSLYVSETVIVSRSYELKEPSKRSYQSKTRVYSLTGDNIL